MEDSWPLLALKYAFSGVRTSGSAVFLIEVSLIGTRGLIIFFEVSEVPSFGNT